MHTALSCNQNHRCRLLGQVVGTENHRKITLQPILSHINSLSVDVRKNVSFKKSKKDWDLTGPFPGRIQLLHDCKNIDHMDL